ncbi:MAG: hypothetical protein KJ600_04550 [Nanoarchaeota archaeon]|nr:hypothetical protein [Nanoarchaeota archaeon]MBU1103798.1 hypothetical protein [Nanoarchaeota archaeon]
MGQKQITLEEIYAAIQNLQREVHVIRENVEETEMTDWAEQELEEARNEPGEKYISLEDLENEIKNDVED